MKKVDKFIAIALLGMLLPLFNIQAQEIGKYVEQYEGRLGARTFKIKLLRIGEKSNEEVLIQVSGVDDPIDGYIYKYKKEWQRSETRLNKYKYATAQIPGKEKFSLFHSDNYYGSQIFKVYLIDNPMEAIDIHPMEYQENLDPNFMYEQYLQQLKSANK
jgi:hypothetical protein